MKAKKMFQVVDVPLNATGTEVEQLLNAPCEDGYYFAHMIAHPPEVGTRALFKLLTRKPKD